MRPVREWLQSRDDEETAIGDGPAAGAKQGSEWFEDDALVDHDDGTLFPDDKSPIKAPAAAPPGHYSGQPGWVLTKRVKFLYGLAEFGTVGFAAIMGFYLNAFLLEVAGVGAGLAGTLLLVSKVVDAVADPFIGWASDRTRSRFGRRKVWIAASMVPLSIAYLCLWIVPPWSEWSKFGYYMGILVLLSVSISCVSLPVSALAPELTENYDERTALMVFKVGVFSVSTIMATFSHSLLIEAFPGHSPVDPFAGPRNVSVYCLNATVEYLNGTLVEETFTDYQTGYLVSAVIWSVLALIPLVLLLIFVPERKAKRKKPAKRRDGSLRRQSLGVWEGFRTMILNRAFVCVMLVYLFSQLAIQFVQNNLFLWTKYVLLREEWFSYLLLVLLSASFLSLPLWERVSRKIGKPRVYVIGACLLVSLLMYMFFVDWMPQLSKDVTVWFAATIAGVAMSSILLIPSAMFPDVIERDELETGLRREGLYYSFFVFFQKMALAGALAISNFVLDSAGYVSPEVAGCSSPAQTDYVKVVMGLMIGPVPGAVLALSLVALWFYPISKEVHLHTLTLLEEQRKRAALVTTDSEVTANQEVSHRTPSKNDGDFD